MGFIFSPFYILQKLRVRRALFSSGKCPQWSAQRKERIKAVLDEGLDYVSSEDSGEDEMTIYRRPLLWLKPKYHKSLRQLDKIHYDSLSTRARRMYRKRVDGEPSPRVQPVNAPEYITVSTPSEDLNSSVNSE